MIKEVNGKLVLHKDGKVHNLKKLKIGKTYELSPSNSRSYFNYTDKWKVVEMCNTRTSVRNYYALAPHSDTSTIPVLISGITNKRAKIKIKKSNKFKDC